MNNLINLYWEGGRDRDVSCHPSSLPLWLSLWPSPSDPLIRWGVFEEVIWTKNLHYRQMTFCYFSETRRTLSGKLWTLLIGQISGLKINWAKSSLLLVDPLEGSLPEEVAQIQVLNKFKYLDINITVDPHLYTSDNIDPFLAKFRGKIQVWKCLPLYVAGRCRRIKMIWMPQVLYVLHNSPIWLYKKWFQRIDILFKDMIWKGGPARIRLTTLQLQKSEGGVALPHPFSYFLASQLQHIARCNLVGREAGRKMLLQNTPHDSIASALEAGSFPSGLPTLNLWEYGTQWKQFWSIVVSRSTPPVGE